MSDSINLMIRDDGVATIYDDTYDITIHCESEEEQRKVVELLKSIPSAQPERKAGRWIPCSERLPEEDHWLGGSGKQFSDNVLVSILDRGDDDEWVDTSHTVDGEWMLELPRYCEIIAWMPLPEAYREEK